MRHNACSLDDLYTVLCQDIAARSPRIGAGLPDSPHGEFEAAPLDASASEYAALALAKSIGKKCVDTVSDLAPARCLSSYLDAVESCRNWVLSPAPRPPKMVISGRLYDNPEYQGWIAVHNRELLELVKLCLQDTLTRPTPESLFQKCPDFDGDNPWSWENAFLLGDIGPGAAIDASGFSWYEKFYQSPLSFTSFNLYEAYRYTLPLGSLRYAAEIQRCATFGISEVLGGKYGDVPKTVNTNRSIDIQPSLNMFAQKGIACLLVEFMRQKYGVDLSVQPFVNRELAKRASISGHLATIDLKEASNRIPWKLVQWLLDGHPVLGLLTGARTERTLMPWLTWNTNYHVSGMGNGFTFPLMTLIFLAVVEAVYLHRAMKFDRLNLKVERPYLERLYRTYTDSEERFVNPSVVGDVVEAPLIELIAKSDLPDWGVFGDDIICPVSIYDDVVRTLGLINAQVNLDKSFHTGSFRESCGGDFYVGQNVRGIYAKSLKTSQDRVSLLNRLVAWSAEHILLPKTCQLLWSSCRDDVTLVPLHEADTAGLKVPSSYAPDLRHSKDIERFGRDTQARIKTYLACVPVPLERKFRGAELSIYGVGVLLSIIRGETSSEFANRSVSDESVKRAVRKPEGMEIPRVFKFLKRTQKDVRYELRWCFTSCWDNTVNGFNRTHSAKIEAVLDTLEMLI